MDLRKLLEGTWQGNGFGSYPEVPEFSYSERLSFTSNSRPFLFMEQRTQAPDGSPLHTEVGYLRFPDVGRVELVVAQPTGITEVLEGSVESEGDRIWVIFESTNIGTTKSAKRVDRTRRKLEVNGDELTSELWMDAMGRGDHKHLESRLHRV